MITEITLRNFKLHESTTISAAPITVFIGPNNSGKSSVFQALLCLKQAVKARSAQGHPLNLIPEEEQRGGGNRAQLLRADTSKEQPYLYNGAGQIQHPNILLGNFIDVVRRGENEIGFVLKGKIKLPRDINATVNISMELRFVNNFLLEDTGALDLERTGNLIILGKNSGEIKEFTSGFSWEWKGGNVQFRPNNELHLDELMVQLSHQGIGPGSSSWGYSGGNPGPERKTRLEEIGRAILESPRDLIRSIHPIYPVRGIEEAGLPFPAYPAADIELAVLADRSVAIGSKLAYGEDVRLQLSDWFKEILHMTFDAPPRPGYRVTLQTGEGTLLVNEGTGAQQLPFIFTPIALAPPGEILLVSEPESHLHPKAQSLLASAFLEIWKRENKQFFIETHSEHVLTTFLNAVAKGKLNKNDLSICYFENQDGVAVARKLNVDEKGRVEGGLPGFFEQTLQEMIEFLEASEPNRS